jgi:hypothetical protein
MEFPIDNTGKRRVEKRTHAPHLSGQKAMQDQPGIPGKNPRKKTAEGRSGEPEGHTATTVSTTTTLTRDI